MQSADAVEQQTRGTIQKLVNFSNDWNLTAGVLEFHVADGIHGGVVRVRGNQVGAQFRTRRVVVRLHDQDVVVDVDVDQMIAACDARCLRLLLP